MSQWKEKAFASVDAEEVKQGRTTALKQFTTSLNVLYDNVLDNEKIEETDLGVAEELHKEIAAKFKIVKELHDHYVSCKPAQK